MKIIEVIPSIRWYNKRTKQTASIYGAVPWTRPADADQWEKQTTGWTWRLDNGTVGLGRAPAKTEQEALEIMKHFNHGVR